MKTKSLVLLLMFSTFFLQAQTNLGAFTGRVLDGTNPKSTPLESVTITFKNESTGYQTQTVTKATGFFNIENLPLGGPYSVSVSAMGYGTKIFKGFTLNLGDNITIPDVILSSSEKTLNEVVVKSSSFKSSKNRIGISTKISGEALNRIPTSSRNYQDLAKLSPLTIGTNIAGARGNARGLMIDGVSNRMNVFGSVPEGAFPVSMEAIREFEIVTNSYNVADGRGGAGTIKAVTKAGTNEFHGAAWNYYTGGSLAGVTVNNVKDQWSKGKKGETTNAQYGFNISGP